MGSRRRAAPDPTSPRRRLPERSFMRTSHRHGCQIRFRRGELRAKTRRRSPRGRSRHGGFGHRRPIRPCIGPPHPLHRPIPKRRRHRWTTPVASTGIARRAPAPEPPHRGLGSIRATNSSGACVPIYRCGRPSAQTGRTAQFQRRGCHEMFIYCCCDGADELWSRCMRTLK